MSKAPIHYTSDSILKWEPIELFRFSYICSLLSSLVETIIWILNICIILNISVAFFLSVTTLNSIAVNGIILNWCFRIQMPVPLVIFWHFCCTYEGFCLPKCRCTRFAVDWGRIFFRATLSGYCFNSSVVMDTEWTGKATASRTVQAVGIRTL